jgi:hypothetical protein
MDIKKLIEEQRAEFRKKFVVKCSDGELLKDVEPMLVFKWHAQCILKFIDAQIERKKGMKKEYYTSKRDRKKWDRNYGALDYLAKEAYNQALSEDISYLEALKEQLK